MSTVVSYELNPQHKSDGFSLIELIVAIAILAIIVTVAIPSFGNSLERKRTQGLTTAIATDMEFLLAEATKRNLNVSMTLSSTGYSIAADNSGTSIPVKSITYANNYPGSSATANFGGSPVSLVYTYNPKLGRLTSSIGSVTVTNGNASLTIFVNPLGRPSVCGAFGGYPACP
ncbi:GspH/FimT family pseudopilin [Neptunomonas sp.]|uniref:GspH/FimT family pseudopilin n=1 Tax=Neptunomonas sp. TaxID=1971898 RepID=UPI00356539BD